MVRGSSKSTFEDYVLALKQLGFSKASYSDIEMSVIRNKMRRFGFTKDGWTNKALKEVVRDGV